MNLKQLIEHERQVLSNLDRSYRRQREVVAALEESRVNCPHEFDEPIPDYEHEGGACKLCGINELYAQTLEKQRTTCDHVPREFLGQTLSPNYEQYRCGKCNVEFSVRIPNR